jgi:hypothetical protein
MNKIDKGSEITNDVTQNVCLAYYMSGLQAARNTIKRSIPVVPRRDVKSLLRWYALDKSTFEKVVEHASNDLIQMKRIKSN